MPWSMKMGLGVLALAMVVLGTLETMALEMSGYLENGLFGLVKVRPPMLWLVEVGPGIGLAMLLLQSRLTMAFEMFGHEVVG